MALRIVSSEWVEEVERDRNIAEMALKNMTKAHDRAVQSYRELRDSKAEEIMRLHQEIEVLKQSKERLYAEIKRLRQAVAYYERLKPMEARDDKAAV